MKQYHSIEYFTKLKIDSPVIAFNKLDGSNLRFEWNQKESKKGLNNGFNKFGTRKQIIAPGDDIWGEGIDIFMNKYSESLDRIFRTNKYYRNAKKITAFAEFYGENSFAGWHDPEEKGNMQLTLFDIDVYQKGILKARDFVKQFGELGIPDIIFEGNYNQNFIDDVRNNVYGLKEGVVVKGVVLTKRKNAENVIMIKIKTLEWLQKVKGLYGAEKLLEEVNGDKSLLSNL